MPRQTLRPITVRDLPATIAYLTERPVRARARLSIAVEELLLVAAREHGKDLGHRRSLRLLTDPDGPQWDETDEGATVTLESHAVEHDFRSQAIYQAAHEVAHLAFSDGSVTTWIDEMLATRFAVRVMEAVAPEYADATVRMLDNEAKLMTAREMQRVRLDHQDTYAEGFYGRAFVTGQQLEGRLGWPVLRRLARPGEPAGHPDLVEWFESLDETQQRSAVIVLGARPVKPGPIRRLLTRRT